MPQPIARNTICAFILLSALIQCNAQMANSTTNTGLPDLSSSDPEVAFTFPRVGFYIAIGCVCAAAFIGAVYFIDRYILRPRIRESSETHESAEPIDHITLNDKIFAKFEVRFKAYCCQTNLDKPLNREEIKFFETIVLDLMDDKQLLDSCVESLKNNEVINENQKSYILSQLILKNLPEAKNLIEKVTDENTLTADTINALSVSFSPAEDTRINIIGKNLLNKKALSESDANYAITFFDRKLKCSIGAGIFIDPCRASNNPTLYERSTLEKCALHPLTRAPINNIESDPYAKAYVGRILTQYHQAQPDLAIDPIAVAPRPNETTPLLSRHLVIGAPREVSIEITDTTP